MSGQIYILYHKPRGIICTTEKVDGNLLDAADFPEGVLPVGRLDKDSEGLLLLTNDKPMINRIIHPDFGHEKEYLVTLNLPVRNKFLREMESGVDLGDVTTMPCVIRAEPGTRRIFRIIVKQGINRQIRRMCSVFDYQVLRLQRIRVMHLELGKLKANEWRYLSEEETEKLLNELK